MTTVPPSAEPDAALLEMGVLQEALRSLQADALDPQKFSQCCRLQSTLLGTLPARYSEVLLDLLDRLESSALFAEESCSFSQQDLINHLQSWQQKATEQLAKRAKQTP